METSKVVAVAGGYHAVGAGAGREIVTFGKTREQAAAALALAIERSFRLQAEADRRRVACAGLRRT